MKNRKIGTMCAVVLFISGCQSFGDPRAVFEEGRKAQVSGDYSTAMRQFRKLAVKGDAPAEYALGEMYEKGQGVAPDLAEAGKWYQMSFDRGESPVRSMAQNKLNEPTIRLTRNRQDAESRPALAYADDSGGLQCPENMEFFHSKLRHQEAHGVGLMVGPNGGFSTNIPEHIKHYGLETTIEVQKDALLAAREAVKGYVGGERREILEDTIKAKEELLNVLWCYQQPGAEVEKAPSRRAAITTVRSKAENQLNGGTIGYTPNRQDAESRFAPLFANDRGGLQCPETMEYFHSELRHQKREGVNIALYTGLTKSPNGGFSTNIPTSIRDIGLEQIIQYQKDGIREHREALKGDIGCEKREILEDTIKAKEELLNVLWCYHQPGAEVAKAPSRLEEIAELREYAFFEPICTSMANHPSCGGFSLRPTPPAAPASSCPRQVAAPVQVPVVSNPSPYKPEVLASDSRPTGSSSSSPSPRKSSPSSGNLCKDAMSDALTGEMLLLNKHPESVGGYLANALFLPFGIFSSVAMLVAAPVTMVFSPSTCHDTTSSSGPSSTYKGKDFKGNDFCDQLSSAERAKCDSKRRSR